MSELLTYCNPLPIPSCPRGVDPWSVMNFTGETPTDYRSISDPSVLYWEGKWYLYPSYSMAWVSEDFARWTHVRTSPYNMKYSPQVIPFRGRFLMTSHSNGLYESDSPTGPFRFLGNFIRPDGSEFCPTDPALFVDDDGRLYLYAFTMRGGTKKRAFITGTCAAELNGDDPRRLLTPMITLHEFDGSHEWEHFGEDRQDTLSGWLEGQWMLKRGGRYYLIYACAGTQYSSYCMAAYISDTSPLSGFRPQKHNPFLENRSGLTRGSGHGCVVEGPGGTLWAFYTIALAFTHIYERRIGMDLIAVNDDGELYAPHGATEIPQFAPGSVSDPASVNAPGWLPLTMRQRAMCRVSSHTEGREGLWALDDSLMTFWQPAPDDPAPTLTVDLEAPYVVRAARLIWREVGLDYDAGVEPTPWRYLIEGRPDADSPDWVILCDASKNDEDFNVDYRTFPPVSVEQLRLTILGGDPARDPETLPHPALISFTAFGVRDESV